MQQKKTLICERPHRQKKDDSKSTTKLASKASWDPLSGPFLFFPASTGFLQTFSQLVGKEAEGTELFLPGQHCALRIFGLTHPAQGIAGPPGEPRIQQAQQGQGGRAKVRVATFFDVLRLKLFSPNSFNMLQYMLNIIIIYVSRYVSMICFNDIDN